PRLNTSPRLRLIKLLNLGSLGRHMGDGGGEANHNLSFHAVNCQALRKGRATCQFARAPKINRFPSHELTDRSARLPPNGLLRRHGQTGSLPYIWNAQSMAFKFQRERLKLLSS